MAFADPTRGNQPWTLGEEEARPILKRAIEAGINFFDTANIYSDGASEELTGRLIKEFAKREEVVIATKVGRRIKDGPNNSGLSRKAIMTEIDKSLKRLGTDYVDLYQIHRADPTTPIEETLEALTDIVKAGKARYLGASSMYAWEFSKMLNLAEANGWTKFISMQNHYNLLYREEEREMHPLCDQSGIGVIPWSPLGGGRLARGWDESTRRGQLEAISARHSRDDDHEIVDEVGKISLEREISRAQVATAWILSKEIITAPIIGVTSMAQLGEAIDATSISLTHTEIERLQAPYLPHPVAGI
ncbi:unnamed protein product [Acidithrix sp. C25]|nr:unnamed protein product [Acidithrix sp. C25]